MTNKKFNRRSWLEVNLTTLKSNYLIYKKRLNNTDYICAVVKADSYGLGSIEVSRTLQSAGCRFFAVSNIDEAVLLRKNNIKGEIIILGYTDLNYLKDLKKYDITQAVLSESYLEDIIRKKVKIKCQMAIDTGMNRIGLDAENISDTERIIRKANKYLCLNGLFTHLCVADTKGKEATEFTKKQIKSFLSVKESVKDLNLPYCHYLNSAGSTYYFKNSASDLYRLGIVLYGLKPDYTNKLPRGVKPIFKWKSVISMIKEVKTGETIGYGRTYKADKNIKVATISTGYADGYNRALSNKGYVIIKGKKAKILGRICMDQFMVDVTGIKCRPYDEVELINDSYNADDMAKDLNTIGYEVACNISKRVNRIYVK